MSKEYDEYLKTHLSNVRKAYDWLYNNIRDEFSEKNWETAKQLCYEYHDLSKTESTLEYDAYDAYYYPKENQSDKLVNYNYHLAWLHHIHNNPHHWNYWVLVETNQDMKALAMYNPYIIEMLSDWMSFSFKAEDLTEIIRYYTKNKDKMVMHSRTREKVDTIINKINEIVGKENGKQN